MSKSITTSSLQELSRSNLRKAQQLILELREATLRSSENKSSSLTRGAEEILNRLEFMEGEYRSYCIRLASQEREEPEDTKGKVNRGRRN